MTAQTSGKKPQTSNVAGTIALVAIIVAGVSADVYMNSIWLGVCVTAVLVAISASIGDATDDIVEAILADRDDLEDGD